MSQATYRGVKYDTDTVKNRQRFFAVETYRGIKHQREVEVRECKS